MAAMFVAADWGKATRIGKKLKNFMSKVIIYLAWVTFITKMLMPIFFFLWEFVSPLVKNTK